MELIGDVLGVVFRGTELLSFVPEDLLMDGLRHDGTSNVVFDAFLPGNTSLPMVREGLDLVVLRSEALAKLLESECLITCEHSRRLGDVGSAALSSTAFSLLVPMAFSRILRARISMSCSQSRGSELDERSGLVGRVEGVRRFFDGESTCTGRCVFDAESDARGRSV